MLLALAIILLILAIGLGTFVKSIFFVVAVLAAIAFVAYFSGRARTG